MENVVIVFPKLEDGKKIRNVLVKNGIMVDNVCTSGAQALDSLNKLNEGIVVCSYRFTDMYYTQLKMDMPQGFEMLLIASSEHWIDSNDDSIMKMSMPLKTFDLLNTIQMMFENQARRRKKRTGPRVRTEEEQSIIKAAKNLLIDRNQMTEAEAHAYLQKCSMDSGNSIVETANMVICLYKE